MSWLRKLGLSKKDKENGDPNFSRNKVNRHSVRCAGVWDNSLNLKPSHRNSVASDWQKPLPPAPYSVVTEPKTSKSSRSCPGGSNGYSYQGHLKDHYQVPDAPIPPPRVHNQSKLNETMQSEREHRYANISMHSNYRPSRNRQGYGGRGTSEYESGSNDPSPTVCDSRNDRRSGRRQRMVMVDANTSNSEYDSEAEEDQLTAILQDCKRLEKENTRLKRKRSEMKENLNHRIMRHQQELEQVIQENRTLHIRYQNERQKAEKFEKDNRRAQAEIEMLRRQLAVANEARHHMMQGTVLPGMTTVDSRSTITGAGEALCSRSTSNTDLANEEADIRIHSSSSATPPIQDDVYNEEDEVKNFRLSDDEDAMERPRTRSPENSDCADFNGNELAHHGSCVLTDDDDLQNANNRPEVVPPVRTPVVSRSPLRRSYSETDVGRSGGIMAEGDSMKNENDDVDAIYCSSVDPILAEYSSSFSSDDEKARAVLLWQQLRHCGPVVRNPRRRNRVNQKTFRSYGRTERKAMSAFDYLQDLSTDVSCLEATPGHSPNFR